MQNETARHKGKQEEGQAGRQDQRQDLVKAIQHQGGHLKKALRTPNSTLFKKNASSDHLENKLGDKLGDKGDKTSGRKMTFPWQVQYKRHVHQSC